MNYNLLPGFLENIFVNAPIGIISTDMNRQITMANQLAARLHGINAGDELIGKLFPDFMCMCNHSPITEKLYKVFDFTLDKAQIDYNMKIGNKVKSIRLFSTLLRDEQYRPIGLLNMCEDITPEVKLANQVRNYTQHLKRMVQEKTKDLNAANQQLIHSEKLRLLGNLVASVAHEIGNPLCSLTYLITDIKDSVSNHEIKKSAGLCLDEIDRMGGLLHRLRGMSRSDDNKKTLISINKLLEDTLQINKLNLQNKKIKLTKKFTEGLPPLSLFADQIKQVFMNIIINAVDSMSNGGKLRVETKSKDQNILIEFADTGAGISKKNLNKIFTPFYTSKAKNGLGLGLSVSKNIILAHQGNIWVESARYKGATFFIRLPVDTAINAT